MAEVIVVTSGKGGVGKTTTTANIGTCLALMGKKTVLVDTDIGLRNLDIALGFENMIVYDIVDVVEGRCALDDAIIADDKCETLFMLPAAQTRDKSAVSVEQMVTLCDELKKKFEYIVIDCPAGIEQGFKNAIAGADRAIVVSTPEISSVRDVDRIVGLLDEAGIEDIRLIVNRIRPELVKSGDMLNVDDIIDSVSVQLIGIVPDDNDVIIANNRGISVVSWDKSESGKAFRNITKRICGENVSIPTKFKKKRFFGKRRKY